MTSMQRRSFLATLPSLALGQSLDLSTPKGLTLHNVEAKTATLKGKACLRLNAGPNAADLGPNRQDHLALLEGTEFSNGTIEVDVAGEPAPGVGGGARGFVGVAFRVQPDRKTYDCFYIRPTNGRADDQERRNHAVQYISHPTYTWSKLREETPSRYEVYADMMPAEWVHLKIEVQGVKAKLYVNNAAQPTLIVNDVKSGPSAKGNVALWFEGSTIAHFANLKVSA